MTSGPTLAVGGATATGKTVLAVELALRVAGELVNADSRQTIRRLRVGTATPTVEELRGVACHLIDVAEPGMALSVADWLTRARTVLDELDVRGVPAVLVGGSGQYLRALRQGWDVGGAPPDWERRAALTVTAATPDGLAGLVAELVGRDPAAAAALDTSNPRRVIRAIELLRDGAPTIASVRGHGAGRDLALVVLDAERGLHRRSIEERVAAMFGSGRILAEVRDEIAAGTPAEALRRSGIGYAEALDLAAGRLDETAAAATTLRRTLRYAKAQRTWFRAEPATQRLLRDSSTPPAALADEVLGALRGPG